MTPSSVRSTPWPMRRGRRFDWVEWAIKHGGGLGLHNHGMDDGCDDTCTEYMRDIENQHAHQ
jgi:hypothetical protein